MKKVLLVHGFTGDGNGLWFPWLKKELEKRGYEVFNPSLPNSCQPNLQGWVDALEPYFRKLDENDMIVAHSLGGKAALHTILRVRKNIGRLILVAPAIGDRSEETWQRRMREWPGPEIPVLRKFWEHYLPQDEVTQFTDVTMIVSDNDPYVPECSQIPIPVGWKKEVFRNYEHFSGTSFTKLLQMIV